MGDPNDVPLLEHILALLAEHEKLHDADAKFLEVTREELNHWKGGHNDFRTALDVKIGREEYYREHALIVKKIDGVERLVYIGIGIWMAVSIAIELMLKH